MPTTVDPEAAQETIDIVQQTIKGFSWQNIAVLVCLLVASIVAIRILVSLADRAMIQARLDRGVRTFLRSGLKVVMWVVAVCALLGYLGVPMTSLVALLSVLGLAVSLAIQGTLSNLAGGIMLLTAHPFAAGDFVDAGGVPFGRWGLSTPCWTPWTIRWYTFRMERSPLRPSPTIRATIREG